MDAPIEPRADATPHVLLVRTGHGANCSSIGSVIDVLFATATVGAAVFAAVVAALGEEDVRVVGAPAGAPAEEGTHPAESEDGS